MLSIDKLISTTPDGSDALTLYRLRQQSRSRRWPLSPNLLYYNNLVNLID